MPSLFGELYYGNLYFEPREYQKDSPLGKAIRQKIDNSKKLMKMMDERHKEQFEKFCDTAIEVESIKHYDIFKEALKFGILLMVEVFRDKQEPRKEEN